MEAADSGLDDQWLFRRRGRLRVKGPTHAAVLPLGERLAEIPSVIANRLTVSYTAASFRQATRCRGWRRFHI